MSTTSAPPSGLYLFRPRGLAVLRGIRIRVLGTIATVFGGAIGLLLFAGFEATHLAWYQNLTVVLAVMLLVVGTVIGMWVSWGMRVLRQGWETVDHDGDPAGFFV